MPPVKLKAVLFDMDGVLVDVSRSYRRAIEETATHFTGRRFEAGTIQRYKNMGRFSDDWRLTEAIITDTGIQVSFHRIVSEFQRRYRGINWDGFISEEPPLFTNRTFARLKADKHILGVITSRPKIEAKWTLNRFGWNAHFPLLVSKEETEGRGKPDPFPLKRALSVLCAAGCDLCPEEVAYFGDSVDDITASRAAGMWAIGFVPPYVEESAHESLLYSKGAHAVLSDERELPEILTSLGKLETVTG